MLFGNGPGIAVKDDLDIHSEHLLQEIEDE